MSILDTSPLAPAIPEPVAPAPVDLATLVGPQLPDDLKSRITTNLSGGGAPSFEVSPTAPAPLPVPANADTSAVILNLPQARDQFAAKYQRLATFTESLPEPIRNSLVTLDMQRVNKGQAPLNDRETLAAVKVAMTKEAVTKPAKDTSILGRITDIPHAAITDLGTILKGIGHLVIPNRGNVIYQELFHNLPHWADEYQKLRDTGLNPVAAFLQSPGVRFIPGSFVASNVAQGTEGLGNLLDHPLMTALDVLPYASEAAKLTTVGAIASEEGSKALSAVLTKKVGAGVDPITDSALTANKLGELVNATKATSGGRVLTEAFGAKSRALARTESQFNELFARALNGKGQTTGVLGRTPEAVAAEQAARDAYSLIGRAEKDYGIAEPRRVEITEGLTTAPDRAAFMDSLAPNEAAFVHEYQAIDARLANYKVANGLLMDIGGEFYDPATGGKLLAARERVPKMYAKVAEEVAPRIAEMLAGIDQSTPAGRLAARRVGNLRDLIDQALDPAHPTTFKDVDKAMIDLKKGRTSLGSPSRVGVDAGPMANIRLDSLVKLDKTIKSAKSAEAAALALDAKTVPARFHDVIQHLADEDVKARLIASGVDPELAAERIALSQYDDVVFTRDVHNELVRDLSKSWRDLKDAGYDPVFVHRVPVGREALLRLPRVSEFSQPVSSSKSRTITDATIYNKDLTVALAHDAAELLNREISQQYIDTITGTLGVTEDVLQQRYLPEARDLAMRDSTLGIAGALKKLMTRDYGLYQPESFKTFPTPRTFSGDPATRVWLPREVIRNLDRIHNPKANPMAMAMALGPATKVFRTSVLATSPRWHIYNIMSGAILLMAERGPEAFLRFGEARQIYKALKDGTLEEGRLPPEVRAAFSEGRRDMAEIAANVKQGGRYADLWNKIQEHKAVELGGKIVQKSYDINSMFDEHYRIMSYLQGEKNAFGAGLSDKAAAMAGLESMRKTAQFWGEMTPIERNVIRQIFPFYAFTGHMMRYVANFPFDHPLRASIVANIARAELADQKDGLGIDLLDSIGLGPIGKDGKQRRLSMSGINPFSNVADTFTMAGFLAGLNPVIQTGLEQAGMQVGGSGVQQQRYNPDTGKLENVKPDLIPSLVGNILPQALAAQRLLGLDPKFATLQRDNPEAARRMMASSMGLPNILSNDNAFIPLMKAELARQTSQKKALTEALRTGDLSEADKYPGLAAYLAQIRALRDAGQLTAYNPSNDSPGTMGQVVEATRGTIPWPT